MYNLLLILRQFLSSSFDCLCNIILNDQNLVGGSAGNEAMLVFNEHKLMSWTYIAPTLILGIRVTGSGGLDNHDVRMALKKVHGSHNKYTQMTHSKSLC